MIAKKAFTLIELLVVVAIIGVLTAVGVIAFNNFAGGAKVNATESIHQQTFKYIAAEVQKCSMGESKFMGTNQDCPATAAKAVTGAVNTVDSKNPYDKSNAAVKASGSFEVGQVSVSSSGNVVTIKTCTKTGCGSSDQLTSTVTVD